MSLAQKLTQKIEADGLTVAKAAEQAGISLPSFRAAVAGKSVPNARSVDKYASFLGISVDEVKALAGDRAAAAPKRGRPAGKGRKPGRPAGAKRGRPAGKVKAGRSVGDAGAALAAIAEALKSSQALAGDALALKVHNLGKKERAIIEAIVGGF